MPAANRRYPRPPAFYAARRDYYLHRARLRTIRAVTAHVLRGDYAAAAQALNDGSLTCLQWEQEVHPALDRTIQPVY